MRVLLALFAVAFVASAHAACEDLSANACKGDNTCFYTKPTKANKYKEKCTTIPATCEDVANPPDGTVPVGVKLGDVCKKVVGESCLYQSPIRRKGRLVLPAACLDMPAFPTLCADAKDYAALVPDTLSDVCANVAEECLYRVTKKKRGRVVAAVCEVAPAPPTTCSTAATWAKASSQTLEIACNAVTPEDCEFYPAVRKKRRGRWRTIKAASCGQPGTGSPTVVPTTSAPTAPIPTNAPTEPPTAAPTAIPCNPTTRCDGKYVCKKKNSAGNNICANTKALCGNKGVKYSNSFCP